MKTLPPSRKIQAPAARIHAASSHSLASEHLPRFSFVLPAFKANYLLESINSILNQTIDDLELIIVNDQSPDDIDSIVALFENDSRIRYYTNEKNIGRRDLVLNWNLCCKRSVGEYLILASDDDVYSLNFLEEVSVLINNYPKVNLIRGRVRSINEEGAEVEKDHLFPAYMAQDDFLYYASRGMISVQAQYVYNRKEFVKRGGFVNFPSAWCSDAATAYMMSDQGVLSTPSIVFTFRKSSFHITGDSSIENKIIKLTANYLYWGWVDSFVSHLSVKNYKTKFFEDVSHHKLQVQFDILLSGIPFYKLSIWIKYCFQNKYLFRSRKIKIFLHAILCQIIHL